MQKTEYVVIQIYLPKKKKNDRRNSGGTLRQKETKNALKT